MTSRNTNRQTSVAKTYAMKLKPKKKHEVPSHNPANECKALAKVSRSTAPAAAAAAAAA